MKEVDERGGEGSEAGESEGGYRDDQNQNLKLNMNQNHGQNQETAEPGQTEVNLFKLNPHLTCRTASSALVLLVEAPHPTILLASLVGRNSTARLLHFLSASLPAGCTSCLSHFLPVPLPVCLFHLLPLNSRPTAVKFNWSSWERACGKHLKVDQSDV